MAAVKNGKSVDTSMGRTPLEGLEYLGVEVDKEANDCRGKEVFISTADSKVKAMIIPINEELVIARDTMKLVNK